MTNLHHDDPMHYHAQTMRQIMQPYFPKPAHPNDRLPLQFEALRNFIFQNVPSNVHRALALHDLNDCFNRCLEARELKED